MKHAISLEEAIQLTSNFRANPAEDVATCETFDKASVITMLSKPDAESFRVYYGRKENGQVCAVLCAADQEGNDLLPDTTKNLAEEDEYLILDDSHRCPELCPPPSPLNP
ncbi:MAG: hypothetical protein V4539_08715 [Bacteroidota bacterium]